MKRKVVYTVNADWYFQMHWIERAVSVKKSGANVSVITPITNSTIQKSIEASGIKVIPWTLSRSGRNLFKEFASIKELRTLIKNESPDLVHSITVKPNIYTMLSTLFLRLNIILSVTGLGMLFTSNKPFDRISGSIVKNLYALASRKHYIFFENDDDLKIVLDGSFSFSSNLKRIMGAGVSAKEYRYSPPLPFDNSLTILFAARLLYPKGLDIIFEAAKALNDKGYKVRVVAAGISDPDSPLAIPKEELERWSGYEFFEFLGSRNDIPELIKDSHFVCLPSTYGEGIPRILIEATAIGRPIITTDVPGCREICVNNFNGILVPPQSSSEIVNGIEDIFSNPEKLTNMSINSRHVFERGYDSDQVIKYTLSIYEELLK